jgi:hypothetical protein
MPKLTTPLTDFKIKSLKPREAPYKESDGGGLYIYVSSVGKKTWRFDYKYNTRQTITFGSYPEISIKQARELLADAKIALQNGVNPMAQKKALNINAGLNFVEDSFESIGREFIELHKSSIGLKQHKRNIQLAESRLFPVLGNRPIKTIKAIDLLAILRDIENQGYFEVVSKVKTLVSQIFRYAIITNRAEHNITVDLNGALKSKPNNHFPSLSDPKDLKRLLLAIDDYNGTAIVKAALN